MPKGFKDTKPMVGHKASRLEDLVEVIKLPNKKWTRVRILGPLWSYVNVWFTIKTKSNPEQPIPKMCLDYNADTEEFESETCPYRTSGLGRTSKFYVVNVIDRESQEDEPRRKGKPTPYEKKLRDMCGYKAHVKESKDSEIWTPVRVLVVGVSLADQLRTIAELNRVKDKKTGKTKVYDISDDDYGIDISIYYDKDAPGTSKYRVQKEERTPLTEEEKAYCLWKLDQLQPEDIKTAKREMDSLKQRIVSEDDQQDQDDQDQDDEYISSKKKSKRSRDDDQDDQDVDQDNLDDLDDDEDEKPRKSKKKRSRDDDQDEDDKPRKKSKKKSSRNDDQDEDEKPRKKKSKRSRDDDQDDLDDLDDE